jgi:hypothetical protein
LSRHSRGRLLVAILALACAGEASADWLLTPFFGTTFAGQSALVQLDSDAVRAKHWMFGGAAAWLSDNILGVEADFAFVPGIFVDGNTDNLITSNSALTLSGNVIAAVPLTVSRESLRPYLVGGLGLMHAAVEDQICLFDCVSLNELALQLGGGAVGLLSERTGVRFDLRQVRTIRREEALIGDKRAKLSFWRATVGVVIRY